MLLQMAALPCQMQYDLESRHDQLKAMELSCAKCEQAQQICVTSINDNQSRKLKKLRLRFPEETVCLVNLKSGLDKVIAAEIEPYSYNTELYGDPQAAIQWVSSISWKIGKIFTNKKAFGGSEKKKVDKLSGLFKKQCCTSTSTD